MPIYATKICHLFLQHQLIYYLKNEYFNWRQNLFFSLVGNYFQIIPLIKFSDILKMNQFLYSNIILRNRNIMLLFVTFSLGVEYYGMTN